MDAIVAKIRGFLESDMGLSLADVENESALFTSGLIDSFALLELLSFLESDLGVKIDIAELGIDDLDTINALAKLAQ